MSKCQHLETYTNLDGETLQRPWKRMFCPDCKVRLEAPGPTRPFHLKPHQR
jgi:RNase P subunit RPR2